MCKSIAHKHPTGGSLLHKRDKIVSWSWSRHCVDAPMTCILRSKIASKSETKRKWLSHKSIIIRPVYIISTMFSAKQLPLQNFESAHARPRTCFPTRLSTAQLKAERDIRVSSHRPIHRSNRLNKQTNPRWNEMKREREHEITAVRWEVKQQGTDCH